MSERASTAAARASATKAPRIRRPRHRPPVASRVVLVVVATLLAAGCGSSADTASDGSDKATSTSSTHRVTSTTRHARATTTVASTTSTPTSMTTTPTPAPADTTTAPRPGGDTTPATTTPTATCPTEPAIQTWYGSLPDTIAYWRSYVTDIRCSGVWLLFHLRETDLDHEYFEETTISSNWFVVSLDGGMRVASRTPDHPTATTCGGLVDRSGRAMPTSATGALCS